MRLPHLALSGKTFLPILGRLKAIKCEGLGQNMLLRLNISHFNSMYYFN